MSTECYAMVRGSAIRVTGLDRKGRVLDPIRHATSKAVASVRINEVVETSRSDILSTPEDERRLRLHKPSQTIRHTVDIDFLRVDPGVLSLVAGVQLTYSPSGDVVGFDSGTRLPAASFALEVWSKLDAVAARPSAPYLGFGQAPFGEGPFGYAVGGAGISVDCSTTRRWGYTVLPYLRGGRIGGFRFHNGLVSFNLVGAQTRRGSQWGVGPHDLEGPFERLVSHVSRNVSYRQSIIAGSPPAQADGIQEKYDVLDNGTATNPMPDPAAPAVVDGGGAYTEAWIIYGGRA